MTNLFYILISYAYYKCLILIHLYLCTSCEGVQSEDEITSATVGLVLDSLDDIHCITESKHKDQVWKRSLLPA